MIFKIKLLIDETRAWQELAEDAARLSVGRRGRGAPARRSGDPPSHRRDAGSAGDVRRSGSPGPSSLGTVPEADFGAGLGYDGPAVDNQAALWCDEGVLPSTSSKKQSMSRPWGALLRGPSLPNRPASPGLGLLRDRRPLPFSPLAVDARRSRPPLPRGMSCRREWG